MKFYKQKTEIQKTITLNFKKKLLADSNKKDCFQNIFPVASKGLFGLSP